MPRPDAELRHAFAAWLRVRLRERGIKEIRVAALLRRDESWLARFEEGRTASKDLGWREAWDLIALMGLAPAEVLASLMHDDAMSYGPDR